jgi:hypothetical protein
MNTIVTIIVSVEVDFAGEAMRVLVNRETLIVISDAITTRTDKFSLKI